MAVARTNLVKLDCIKLILFFENILTNAKELRKLQELGKLLDIRKQKFDTWEQVLELVIVRVPNDRSVKSYPVNQSFVIYTTHMKNSQRNIEAPVVNLGRFV